MTHYNVSRTHAASDAPSLADQLLTFIKVAIRGEGGDPSLAGFLVQSAVDAEHLPAGHAEAAALIERFIRVAVSAATRRDEIQPPPEGLADLLMGLIWGMAFQLCRGDDARADQMLDRLCVLLDQGLAA